MLKTLHSYLLKDLLKVSLLSLVAITLLMSVLVIIQPLRKLGLAGEQLLQLFLYTIPVMLSLTRPIATLFAGTLVYGRFSQDNELLAAKASGISALSLLRPALGMGVVVTLLSLAMINVVAPRLSNLAGLVQNPLDHDPFADPEGATVRRNQVLARMAEQGYIDQVQLAEASGIL